MAGTIIAEEVEIWVSRDFNVYTHKIYRGGVLQSAAVISRARAQEIIGTNPAGQVRGRDGVDFGPGAKQFTWIARVEEVGDGDQ